MVRNGKKWFEENSMKANSDKFQAICIGKKTDDNIDTFCVRMPLSLALL